MSEVQQDQIEAGLSRQPRRSNERLSHAWHVVVAHRRGDNRPATLAERTIHALAAGPCGAARAGVPELEHHAGLGLGVDAVHDPPPDFGLLLPVDPARACGDSALR